MIEDFFYRTLLWIEETARTLHKAWELIRLIILSSNIGWMYKDFEEKLEEAAGILENLIKTILNMYIQYAEV
mgnify:CR=1 FL=1